MRPKSRQKRVLHVLAKLWPGGIQVQLARLLPALAAEYDVEVMSLHEGGSMAEVYERQGIRIRHCSVRGRDPEEALKRLCHAIRRIAPDIVHAHDRQAVLLSLEAARRAGVPVRIAHYHTPHPNFGGGDDLALRELNVLKSCSRVVHCAEWVRADLARRLGGLEGIPVAFAPNAVDLRQFTPPATAASEQRNDSNFKGAVPVIGTVSRIDPVKNHAVMFEAVRLLKSSGQLFEFWVVGDGWRRYTESLKQQAEALGLSDRLLFRGHLENPVPALQAMDVFVLASRNEGMPLAILEAWACGVPVIAAAGGALSGQIRDGEDGLLTKLRDPVSLADALKRLLADAPLRERLAEAGLRRAQECSVERAADVMRGVYAEALSANRRWRQRLPFWRSA